MMKDDKSEITNFFGVIESDRFHATSNNASFACKTIPEELIDELIQLQPKYKALQRKALIAAFAGVTLMLIWILIPATIILFDAGFLDVYREMPWLFAIAVAAFVGWVFLMMYTLREKKKTQAFSGFRAKLPEEMKLMEKCIAALEIPPDAVTVDMLAETYVVNKHGIARHKAYSLTGVPIYENLPTPVYCREGILYLSDYTQVFAIPLQSLKSASRTKRRVAFPNWNKEESSGSKKYKQFKIRKSDFYYSYCLVVDISDERGQFQLIIPNYDGEAFLKLTHPQLDGCSE